MAYRWRSQDSLSKLVLSCHHVGSENLTQVSLLVSLSLLSHCSCLADATTAKQSRHVFIIIVVVVILNLSVCVFLCVCVPTRACAHV